MLDFVEDAHGWRVEYGSTFIGRLALVDTRPHQEQLRLRPVDGEQRWYWRDAGEFSLTAGDLRQVAAKLDEINGEADAAREGKR